MATTNTQPQLCRKLLLLVLATLAIVGLGAFGFASVERTFVKRVARINGYLSRRDLAAIRRVVQHETWRNLARLSPPLLSLILSRLLAGYQQFVVLPTRVGARGD